MLLVLVALNALSYSAQLFGGEEAASWIEQWLALSREGIATGFYWQFVTYLFLHVHPLHLLVNMALIFVAGRLVEPVIGIGRFLGLYLLAGVAGGAAQLLASPEGSHLMGASAAGFAVLIAFTTMLPEMELGALIFFLVPIRMKARYLGWGVMIAAAAMPFTGWGGGSVGHIGHLVGIVVGWTSVRLMGYGDPFFFQRYLRRRRELALRLERLTAEQFLDQEVDPILEKIARHGMRSLTRQERRLLQKGREKILGKVPGR